MLTHFSLCSGIGGLDLAAEWAGFETVGQCEIDKYASRVLAKNFKGVKNYGDIRTITAERLAGDGVGDITVLSAGIPCQPYSLAGKGLGDCDSRDLEQELVRVVGEVRPKWLVVENTPGLFSRKNQRYFDRIVNDISALGYGVAWGLWGACDVGAPHRRERVFIVCRNADSDDETEKKAIQKGENAQSCGNSRVGSSNRNVSDAVGERRGTNEIQRGNPKKKVGMRRTEGEYKRAGCNLSEYVSVFPTPQATSWGCAGARAKLRRLEQDGVITETERKGMQAGNGGKLNPGWVEWLMGFPIGWTDCAASVTR